MKDTVPIDNRWELSSGESSLAQFSEGVRWMGNKQPIMTMDLLPGTLDLLILKTLTRGPMHGYGIAQHLKQVSEDVIEVGEGSLYPALQRLLLNGWVAAEWGQSENNRRARYYRPTALGRKRLAVQEENFGVLLAAIARVLQTA
jgi:PadR family transcriptional regulator